MRLYPVNHNTVDVFLDEGWYNHSRFKLIFNKKEGNKIFQIKGNKVSPLILKELYSLYEGKRYA